MQQIAIVLVEPLYAGNVGSVARAMKNMGLKNLVLVKPHCDPKSMDAIKMAVGARDLLATAKIVPTLEKAIAPAHVVIGTSRRVGRHRRSMMDPRGCAGLVAGLGKNKQVAILFGREDRGLTNVELARCHYRVSIPSHLKAPSLNVAQAVMVVAYEIYLQSASWKRGEWVLPSGSFPPAPDSAGAAAGALFPTSPISPVSTRLMEPLYAHLEEVLQAIGFLDPVNPLRGMRIARGIFGKAGLTRGEVQFVRGICRQMLWKSRESSK